MSLRYFVFRVAGAFVAANTVPVLVWLIGGGEANLAIPIFIVSITVTAIPSVLLCLITWMFKWKQLWPYALCGAGAAIVGVEIGRFWLLPGYRSFLSVTLDSFVTTLPLPLLDRITGLLVLMAVASAGALGGLFFGLVIRPALSTEVAAS